MEFHFVKWLETLWQCKLKGVRQITMHFFSTPVQMHYMHHFASVHLSVWPPQDAVVGCKSQRSLGQGQMSHESRSN